ncbi:hypothetical protein [Legionella oakridgensis]|uniref:Serine/threonine-protein kinase n=1 Tax=Legionella oakridgensis TaxID=29423 RepID=A0A0W0X1I1_9GAMM|nr:hypothetical protein [Legionella oakridgensis]KTD38435.1 serine/threonine-protein kinase [Legionella oakridgensis]STY21348.1 serine/threonine-protein kinase [Legionella longbeachae]
MLNKLDTLSNPQHSQDIEDINLKIAQINALIDNYNRADIHKKPELLIEIQQAHRLLDVSIRIMTFIEAGDDSEVEYINKLHQTFIDAMKNEFRALGAPSFQDAAINAWEIEHIKSDAPIPSPTHFAKMTRPGFWARLSGASTSTAATTVIRLLGDINQSSIKENTKENYQKLTEIKRSIRDLLANEQISASDEEHLRQIITTINGRIFDILENNPVLKREIIPPHPLIANQLAAAGHDILLELTEYLAKTGEFDAEEFHRKFDDKFPGLEAYTIRYLGGGNSQNYLLEDPISQETYVLKITPTLGNNRQTSERLRHTEVGHNMARVYASREQLRSDDMYRVFSLELTEFCAQGDVLAYGIKMDTPEKKIASAWSIYDQMADILLHFGANNALFPDMKPTNFLITEDGKLMIADTKSFIDTTAGVFDRDGEQFNRERMQSQYYMYTPGFTPPELEEGESISKVDKHHAYLLGFSLYLYLTDQDISAIPNPPNPDFFSFNHPIFQTPKGQQYQQLLTGLLNQDPEERFSLREAKQRLDVIQHGIKVEQSPFKSKTEAYFYAIHHLMGLQQKYSSPLLAKAIDDLKILLENHEQNPKIAAKLLTFVAESLSERLEPQEMEDLQNIAHAISSSAYHQTLQEKHENPLARRFESQMQIELLQHPTTAMMTSVGKVSQGLLNVFAQMEEQGMQEELDAFAASLTSGKNQTGFGSQPEEIDYRRVKEILTANDPKDLNQILFIQFLFAQKYMRTLPESIQAPNKGMPTGTLRQIIVEYNDGEFKDNPAAFFDEMDVDKLRLISDVKIYGSALYTAESGRGRKGSLPEVQSSQMGVMLAGQSEEGLPVDPSSWTPDAKYQEANLDSIYVRDLIENDAVYAAGPSGMTSLFLNMMEMYGNLPDVHEKQHYFAAVSAYMVSGGLHSLHEVLGPAQYALDLIPGYAVTPPQKEAIAPPPNFHQFYQQQMDIDPEFRERYQQGWDKLMAAYAREQPLHVHRPIAAIDPTSVVQQVAAKEAMAIRDTKLTSAKAADRLVDILNKAATEYSEHITQTSPIRNRIGIIHTHGEAGIERAINLVEQARTESTLGGVMQQIHLNFSESKAKSYSFISFLFNELKKDPELIAFINQNNASDNQLHLNPDQDYRGDDSTADRLEAFTALKTMDIREAFSEEADRYATFRQHMEALRHDSDWHEDDLHHSPKV